MSPDLLAGSISDPQSLNRYTYVTDDPVNFVDPLGLCGTNDVTNAAAGSINLTPGALELCGLRDTFGDRIFDLPGHGNIIRGELWRFLTDPDGPGTSVGEVSFASKWLEEITQDDTAQWWKNFAKSLFTETYRQPNESFTDCTNRAATTTVTTLSGGLIKSDQEAAAEFVAGVTGVIGMMMSTKMVPGSWVGALGGGWVRPSSVLGAFVFGTRLGVVATRISFQVAAAVGAAEVGLRIGSALDCVKF